MAVIHIYNTLSRKKEKFTPLVDGKLSMYQCGPTVYDSAHIGNFRTFVMNDIIRRVFEYNQYFVTQVMNVTDVDDKTIARAKAENTTLAELTRRYETLFFEDMQSLNILIPHRVLRAREHVDEMIEMISTLLENGVAYPSGDGIYFSIGKSVGYGTLAHLKVDAISSKGLQERISNDEYEKENPRDFALWKFSGKSGKSGQEKTDENSQNPEAIWDAPFGAGRPGWHIECSAMATLALGPMIDIHTGGSDLIFPHHTNEIAQSEAATGKPFVNYWIHGGFMNVNDAKMAKSKGNFLKLADLEADLISPLGFRYWLLTAHYRSQVNFSIEAVKAAQQAFIRLAELFLSWGASDANEKEADADKKYIEKFTKFINDDFDTAQAVALTWEMVKDKKMTDATKRATLLSFDKVFGLGFDELKSTSLPSSGDPSDIPAEITVLADLRNEARKVKDWAKADALRAEIEERGYVVKDQGESSVVSEG